MKVSRLCLLLMAVLLPSTLAYAGDKKDNSGLQSTLKIVVLKDDNGKPVRNAAVILHPVGDNGKQAKGGFELKTNSDGQTESDGIPYGKLRLQVIAPGFQTFGEDYDINQPEQTVTIRLKRPRDQYSIYPDQAKGKQ